MAKALSDDPVAAMPWLNRWKRLDSPLLLFSIALVVRLCFILVLHTYTDVDRYELERTAISLATTGVYGNPYAIPTGSTAHVSPGYTVILAGIFWLFGTGVKAEIIKNVFAAIVTSVLCALIPFVAREAGMNKAVGFLSGLFCALFPIKALTELQGDWDAPYTAIALAVLILLTCKVWAKRSFTAIEAIKLGSAWGISLLFASVLLPLYCLLALSGLFWNRKISLSRYASFLAIQSGLVLLFLLPWIVRNQIALGAPIASRSNLGIELKLSNNDYATADQRINYLLGVYHRYHPLQNLAEAQRVRDLGEVRYNALAQRDAFTWIKAHQRNFVVLTINRIRCFWLYPEPSQLKGLVEDALAIFAAGGLVFLYQERRLSWFIISASLLCYSAPSYLVHVGNRQRFPIDWLLVMLSFYCFSMLQKVLARVRLAHPIEPLDPESAPLSDHPQRVAIGNLA